MADCCFDELIDRHGSDSMKWDILKETFGREDLLSMWIADMDFRTPSFVTDAIREQLDEGVLGYTVPGREWSESIAEWLYRRHQWTISPDWLSFVPGVVKGQAYALQCFTNPGDKVLIMSPVYHPFFLVTEHLNRQVVRTPLILDNDRMELDFERFERDIQGCAALILCNPHNPGGRVWTLEELRKMAHICYQNHVFVISDEIHADLTLPGYKHHPFATVSAEAAAISLTLMAPSKTFNMPGLASSYAIVTDEKLRTRFQAFMASGEFDHGHIFAYHATACAYRKGEAWLGELLDYLQANIDFTESFLRERLPQLSMIRPEASFLIYLNCKQLGLSQENLVKLFVEKAHLALNDGSMFGEDGTGYMRMNIACPRARLEQALCQLEAALK